MEWARVWDRACGLAAVCVLGLPCAGQTFVGFDGLVPDDWDLNQIYLSDDAQTVAIGGRWLDGSQYRAFGGVWTPGAGFEQFARDDLDVIRGLTVQGVSGDGSTVIARVEGGTSVLGGYYAARWTRARGLEITPDGFVGVRGTQVRDVSADGTRFVGTLDLGAETVPSFGATWDTRGSWDPLQPATPGVRLSEGHAISRDGRWVTGYSRQDDGQPHAVLWNPGGEATDLGVIARYDDGTAAYALSDDGSVVFGSALALGRGRAWRWAGASPQLLDFLTPGDDDMGIWDVTGDGRLCVGYSQILGGNSEAIIWDEVHGTRSLESYLTGDLGIDLAGWELTQATSITVDGRWIAGRGISPDGSERVWMVRVPAPGVGAPVLVAFGVLAARRRRVTPGRS